MVCAPFANLLRVVNADRVEEKDQSVGEITQARLRQLIASALCKGLGQCLEGRPEDKTGLCSFLLSPEKRAEVVNRLLEVGFVKVECKTPNYFRNIQ